MKWMKERDLLIAQTMAFVQSVTGKTPEAEKTVDARIGCHSARSPSRHPNDHASPAAALPVRAPLRRRRLPTLRRCWRRRQPAAQAPTVQAPTIEVSRKRHGRYRGRFRCPVPTCGRISSPRSGRGSPVSAPIRSGSTASARPIAAATMAKSPRRPEGRRTAAAAARVNSLPSHAPDASGMSAASQGPLLLCMGLFSHILCSEHAPQRA